MLIKIGKEFNDYVSKLQSDYLFNERRIHRQAWEDAFSFCKNLINVSLISVYNNGSIFPWFLGLIVVHNTLWTTIPTELPLIIETVQPLIDLPHILSVYKNLHLPNVIPNAIIVAPADVQYYIITPTAWETFFASTEWSRIVTDNHTIYSGIIAITIIVLTTYYFS